MDNFNLPDFQGDPRLFPGTHPQHQPTMHQPGPMHPNLPQMDTFHGNMPRPGIGHPGLPPPFSSMPMHHPSVSQGMSYPSLSQGMPYASLPYPQMPRPSLNPYMNHYLARLGPGYIERRDNKILSERACKLYFRQQPQTTQVFSDPTKLKERRYIDPVPILQLEVDDKHDKAQTFIHSPYLFAVVTLVDAKGENVKAPTEKEKTALWGVTCSSLLRFKEHNNGESALFMFNDVSVRVIGEFRLKVTLFDLNKENPHSASAHTVMSIFSDRFKVVGKKDYIGPQETSGLARAIHDQGYKLRVRKEGKGKLPANNERPGRKRRASEELSSGSRTPPNPAAAATSPPAESVQEPENRSTYNTGAPQPYFGLPSDNTPATTAPLDDFNWGLTATTQAFDPFSHDLPSSTFATTTGSNNAFDFSAASMPTLTQNQYPDPNALSHYGTDYLAPDETETFQPFQGLYDSEPLPRMPSFTGQGLSYDGTEEQKNRRDTHQLQEF